MNPCSRHSYVYFLFILLNAAQTKAIKIPASILYPASKYGMGSSEIKKNKCNDGESGNLFYFRDNLGNEIDLVVERETGPLAIEIKSASKPDRSLLKGLKFWRKYQPNSTGLLLYRGKNAPTEDVNIQFLSWEDLDSIR